MGRLVHAARRRNRTHSFIGKQGAQRRDRLTAAFNRIQLGVD